MVTFGRKTLLLAILGVAMALFMYCPASPQMSDGLQEWKARGKYFTFKDWQIFYQDDIGKAEDGSVLVCLHGFPTLSYDWSKMWDQLTTRFSRVIAADFLGYGFSDKPLDLDYTIGEQADIIESLLKKLGVDKFHILAHDFGDTVAQELLYRFELRKEEQMGDYPVVRTVCLLNGGMFPETNHPRLGQKLLLEPWLAPILKRLTTFSRFKNGMAEIFGPSTQPTEEDFADFYYSLIWNDGHLVMDRILQFVKERKTNREKWVGAMQRTFVPLHVIYGPADPVNPPPFINHYKGIIPNPSITVLSDHIGHYPQWEDPDATTKAYFTFLVMPSRR